MWADHQSRRLTLKKVKQFISPLPKKDLLVVWSNFLRRFASQISELEVSSHLDVCIFVLFLRSNVHFPPLRLSLQITKQQLQQTKDRFQAFLNGDTQIVADEAFINAVQSYTEVSPTFPQFAKQATPSALRPDSSSNRSCCFPSPSCEQSVKMVAEALRCVDYES